MGRSTIVKNTINTNNADIIFGNQYADTFTENMRLTRSNPTSRLGIGTADPSEKLHVDGNILASGNITAYSDIRFKKNILTMTIKI